MDYKLAITTYIIAGLYLIIAYIEKGLKLESYGMTIAITIAVIGTIMEALETPNTTQRRV